MTTTPIEAVARALYRMNGHPRGDTAFESEPMWQRYIARSRDIFEDIRDNPPEDVDPAIWRIMLEYVMAAKVERNEG